MKIIKKVVIAFLVYVAMSAVIVLFFRFVNPAVTSVILSKSDNPISQFLSLKDFDQSWTSIENISKYAPLAVVASEDQIFFEHFGFDFEQIEKAIKENERRRKVRGASTITQQTAKNLFLWGGKNIIRKGIEAYYTVLLELLWSKKRILEVYLNIAEMGDGIYGVGAASNIFFKKSPKYLTAAESAFLVAVLPSPIKRKVMRPSPYVLKRKEQILNQMNLIGGLQFITEHLK